MDRIKSITFDKEAQDNLPQHIKDKMKADRDDARKKAESKGLNIPVVSKSVICDYCQDTGWDSYPNHDTTMRPCPECQPYSFRKRLNF